MLHKICFLPKYKGSVFESGSKIPILVPEYFRFLPYVDPYLDPQHYSMRLSITCIGHAFVFLSWASYEPIHLEA